MSLPGVGLRAIRPCAGRTMFSLRTNPSSTLRALCVAGARFQQSQRTASTESYSHDEELKLLNKQRAVRPSSPHFTIYQPQLTWYSSIANRATGVGLSVALYGLAITYVAFPVVGLGYDSQSVVSLVSALPTTLKVIGKTALASAFWYHTFNGLRHLSWDAGYFLTLKSSYAAGYTVLAATAVATLLSVLFV